MDTKYENMSAGELNAALTELYDKLDDTEMLRDSVLGQTGNHVSGRYIKRFEKELSEINDEIAVVKKALDANG